MLVCLYTVFSLMLLHVQYSFTVKYRTFLGRCYTFHEVCIYSRDIACAVTAVFDLKISSVYCFLTAGVKVKVKFTVEQAMKTQRGSRVIAILFL